MFSRTWHGIVPLEFREGFEKYEYDTGIKDTAEIPGNRGAYLKVVEKGMYAHFFLCTIWESMESMMQYSGADSQIAVDYPKIQNMNLYRILL